MDIIFKGYECELKFGQYMNGNTAIQLVEKGTGQPVANATVNGDRINNDNEVGIKDWSENNGMAAALVDADVIDFMSVDIEPSGFVIIGYYELTDKAVEVKNKALEEVNHNE